MSRIDEIAVCVETAANDISIGNVLLHEIHHALTKLLVKNQETLIDLQNFPLSNSDKQKLLDILGQGEVKAELDALGHSFVWETTFPGVWVVKHYDPNQVLISHTLEITWIPAIIKSHSEDVQAGLERLQQQLSFSCLEKK